MIMTLIGGLHLEPRHVSDLFLPFRVCTFRLEFRAFSFLKTDAVMTEDLQQIKELWLHTLSCPC